MTIWFTSDTHYLHANIIKYTGRPWDSRNDMCAALINNWNEVVNKKDEVYHLGDVSLGPMRDTIEILQSLNGRKHLIWGNHDSPLHKDAFRKEFVSCENYRELKIQDADAPRGKQHIVLCHYPLYSWNKAYHGSWMLHGHMHSLIDETNRTTTRLDVGVDSHNYYPISYDQVKKIMSERAYQPVRDDGNTSVKK